jgi:hypothetical protein
MITMTRARDYDDPNSRDVVPEFRKLDEDIEEAGVYDDIDSIYLKIDNIIEKILNVVKDAKIMQFSDGIIQGLIESKIRIRKAIGIFNV